MTAAAFPDGALQPVLPLLTAGGRRSRGRKKVRARRWVKQLRDNSRKVRVRGALRIGDVFRRGRSKSKADWSSRSNQCVWLRLIFVFASMPYYYYCCCALDCASKAIFPRLFCHSQMATTQIKGSLLNFPLLHPVYFKFWRAGIYFCCR